MISKVHFGKRIAKLRKENNMTQYDLAEILGVTSQAVSKWECGAALPDIDILLELSHLYRISINDMLEDKNMFEKIANRPYEYDGIAYFLPKEERVENIAWADDIMAGQWISRNWNNYQPNVISNRIAEKVQEHGGRVLEIGAGPGGGFVPCILKNNPDASVIISDLSPTVIREWKRHLDKEIDSPEISYAVFNFCDMPFHDNSIDIVSDGGGIGNTESGTKEKALKEVYRVLKPGGLLITSTGFVTKETLSALPEHVQSVLKKERPDILEDLYEATVLAGFKKIDSIISGEWYTDEDESTIADLARSLGVNLKFTAYVRFCEKDGRI